MDKIKLREIEPMGEYWEDYNIVTKLNVVIRMQNKIIRFLVMKNKELQ